MFLALLALLFISLVFLFGHGVEAKGPLMAVLGSGGHTGELLTVLKGLRPEPTVFVYGAGDALSVHKAQQLDIPATFVALPRARNVHQSFRSAVFSSLRTLWYAQQCVRTYRPSMVICNGPGTALIVLLATRVLLLRTKVIYIESFARVRSLSLTGRLIYHFRLADRFLVQWPELAEIYQGTEYTGPLV